MLNEIEKATLIDCIYMAVSEGWFYRENAKAASIRTGLDTLDHDQIDELLRKLGASDEMIDEINSL